MKAIPLVLLWMSAAAAQVVPGHYIVELRGEPAAEAAVRQKAPGRRLALMDRRARIAREQMAVRRLLEQEQAEVLASLDTLANALAVRTRPGARARLEKLAGVARVHPVLEMKMTMDRALSLQGARGAWAWVGQERAGEGVKIAIIDTGIDFEHPAFQDGSLPMPEGYPRAGTPEDLAFTSNKVIVARNYETLFTLTDPPSLRDYQGHGTSVAMCAAGVLRAGPQDTVGGVAPRAYLGSYKVFPGRSGSSTRGDVMLKAMEDAVLDGMNVLNLSIGGLPAARPEADIFSAAIDRAAALGVVVVRSAGNNGPNPATIGDDGKSNESSLTVGASENDRFFAATAVVGGATYVAIPGNGPKPAAPVTAPLRDVSSADFTGLACSELPAGSLAGSIALILRGTCNFEVKLDIAQRAGAVGGLVYTDAARPATGIMDVASATLPAMMVSYADGLAIKRQPGGGASPETTLDFQLRPMPRAANLLTGFSSRGPAVNYAIKPDVVAVGNDVYTARSKDEAGSKEEYKVTAGTSFTAPTLAGAAAVVMAAHPNLPVAQYRSLLVNTATPIVLDSGRPAPVQHMGAGRLNLEAAVRSTLTAFPVSVSFGAGSGTVDLARQILVSNLGIAAETCSLSVVPHEAGAAPTVSPGQFQLAPGASAALDVRFTASGLTAGEYQGFLRVTGTRPEADLRIPYWYAVASATPRYITLMNALTSGAPGAALAQPIMFRVTDASGVAILSPTPQVDVLDGGGSVVRVYSWDSVYPGVFVAEVRLGPREGATANVFRIRAGDVLQTVTIEGKKP